MSNETMSNKLLENTLCKIVEEGMFPNLQLICPDEEVLRDFVVKITHSYTDFKEHILNIHVLDIQNEQNIINNILAFCCLKSLSMLEYKLKLLLVYQYTETLSENIINTLEECIKNKHIRLILITTNIHVTPNLLRPKIATFNLKPNKRIIHNLKEQDSDAFFKLVRNNDIVHTELSKTIQEWCKLHTMYMSNNLFDEWKSNIVS